MLRLLVILALLWPTAANAAPYAVLYVSRLAVELVDLGSLGRPADRVRYTKVSVYSAAEQPVEAKLDHSLHEVEVDCPGERSRVLSVAVALRGGKPEPQPWAAEGSDWQGVDPDEHRLVCKGERGGLQVIPALDVARAILNSGAGRDTD